MTVDINTGFANGDRLKDIREEVLNPIAVRAKTLMDQMGEVRPLAKRAFTEADKDLSNKTITLSRTDGPDKVIELAGMFREGSDLALVDKLGNKIPDVSEIAFHDSIITNQGSGRTDISYEWDKLVPAHQDKMTVSKFDQPATQKPNHLIFKGATTEINHSGDTTTVIIPEGASIKGAIGTGTAQTIETINLSGNTSSSSLQGTTLQIHIPDGGGGGGGITNQNFKGFYDSLGDIESQVTDAISGKSYAFAKDTSIGDGTYYTPYFYVNNSWSELKQDPALTYSGPSDPQTHGVFSIKPDSRITVDNLGQIDLSKLSGNGFFEGFYETQEALIAAVPNPTLDKSFAYVKVGTTGAWVAQYYTNNSSGNTWLKVAPQGAMPFVELNTDGSIKTMQNFYAVKKNSKMSVDKSGLLSFAEADTSAIKVDVIGKGGTESGAVETLEFAAGKSYATISDKKLTLNHPQRVIQYNDTFEMSHNTNDYEGNIFYDETSRCWMGWGIPSDSGGVDKKWSRIAHPKMSDEVKDLSKRLPAKAPYVDPGVLGDAAGWRYTGWTYVRKDDGQLPADFRERCGAYFITIIQDVANDSERPQERYQICYADEDGATSYVRRWKRTATTGEYGWQAWVKISMSAKDITDHNSSPESHKEHHKFYKVGTVDATWTELKNGNYKIKDSDLLLIADSHGLSKDGEDAMAIPYTGQFRFSGRVEFDGWKSSSTHPKPQFIMYVYKVTSTQETIVAEFGYSHTDHTKPIPPLKWKSGDVSLKAGDKIRFEFKDFGGTLVSETDLRLVPSRTYFVVEDINTTAGSRIATTHKRTMGAINSRGDVGVNVHRASAGSDTVRVYGLPLATTTVAMNKVTK